MWRTQTALFCLVNSEMKHRLLSGSNKMLYVLLDIIYYHSLLNLSVCLSVCPSVYWSVHLSCLSDGQSVSLSICQSICLSVCQSVDCSVCLSVCQSVGHYLYSMFLCRSAHLSVPPFSLPAPFTLFIKKSRILEKMYHNNRDRVLSCDSLITL